MKLRLALALAWIALFLVANRGAFEGYFSDDDLDNLSWATRARPEGFFGDYVSLRFSENNTRATGALFYHFAGRAFGLDFSRYVPILFTIHLLNTFLIGWLAYRRGAGEWGAWAAAFFWGFHAALLEAWWKPMYVFDLLCGTFCLITWLLYGTRWWWAGIATFLIAYRAKEVAIFLPVALALDNWRRVWLFAALSANFGLQAMLVNAGRNNDYTLRFSWSSLVLTLPFYFWTVALNKWGALLLAASAYFARERKIWFGVAGTLAMILPLVFLPRRLFSVYWYVPLIPASLGLAFLFARMPQRVLSAGLAAWLGLSFLVLREKRKTELALAHENRAYVEQLKILYDARPFPPRVFYEGIPPGLRAHGIQGALRLISGRPDVEILDQEQESARRQAAEEALVALVWFRPTQALSALPHRYRETRLGELDFSQPSSAWQLRDGWFHREGGFRWAGERAALRLLAPAASRRLELRFNVGQILIERLRRVKTSVFVNGAALAQLEFVEAGTPLHTLALPSPLEGEVEVRLESSPGLKVQGYPAPLGIGLMRIALLP